jgi:hypothetical protein
MVLAPRCGRGRGRRRGRFPSGTPGRAVERRTEPDRSPSRRGGRALDRCFSVVGRLRGGRGDSRRCRRHVRRGLGGENLRGGSSLQDRSLSIDRRVLRRGGTRRRAARLIRRRVRRITGRTRRRGRTRLRGGRCCRTRMCRSGGGRNRCQSSDGCQGSGRGHPTRVRRALHPHHGVLGLPCRLGRPGFDRKRRHGQIQRLRLPDPRGEQAVHHPARCVRTHVVTQVAAGHPRIRERRGTPHTGVDDALGSGHDPLYGPYVLPFGRGSDRWRGRRRRPRRGRP